MEEQYFSEFEIDMHDVKDHYKSRKDVSKRLKGCMQNGDQKEYVELALGITDPLGNYSAHEHSLGPRILENNSISSIYKLAQRLASEELKITNLPKIIYQANLSYLKISVGSEMTSLLQPDRFWIGNVRTIWSHLVVKNQGD